MKTGQVTHGQRRDTGVPAADQSPSKIMQPASRDLQIATALAVKNGSPSCRKSAALWPRTGTLTWDEKANAWVFWEDGRPVQRFQIRELDVT
jgi:hypothetical protein